VIVTYVIINYVIVNYVIVNYVIVNYVIILRNYVISSYVVSSYVVSSYVIINYVSKLVMTIFFYYTGSMTSFLEKAGYPKNVWNSLGHGRTDVLWVGKGQLSEAPTSVEIMQVSPPHTTVAQYIAKALAGDGGR